MQGSDPRPGAQAAPLPLAALQGDVDCPGGFAGQRSSAESLPRRCEREKGICFDLFRKRDLGSLPVRRSTAFLKYFLFSPPPQSGGKVWFDIS